MQIVIFIFLLIVLKDKVIIQPNNILVCKQKSIINIIL